MVSPRAALAARRKSVRTRTMSAGPGTRGKITRPEVEMKTDQQNVGLPMKLAAFLRFGGAYNDDQSFDTAKRPAPPRCDSVPFVCNKSRVLPCRMEQRAEAHA